MKKSQGIKLKSVKPPKVAAALLVDEYKGNEFINKYFAANWLEKRIVKELEDRDAAILQDVNEAVGGTC